MNYLGRIIGVIIGFRFGGIFGALFGLWLGYQFDKRFSLGKASASHEAKQARFFKSAFRVMGHMAKMDGTVSRAEIKQAEAIMRKLNLTSDKTREAQELFRQGKKDTFNLDDEMQKFSFMVGKRSSLAMMFLEIQINFALADGKIDGVEREVLLKICGYLGIPQILFDQLVSMLIAASSFGTGGTYSGSGQTGGFNKPSIDKAYAVLGVKKTDTETVIKRAYRKLLSQHHPDKLQAKGLPDEMIKMAADKTHEIRQAYELIRKERGFA